MTTIRQPSPGLAPGSLHPPLSRSVAEMLDPFTTGRLAEVDIAGSSRCLVIGAGTDGIARWLAGRVGRDGAVVVIDADPGRVPAHPGVTVLRHDFTVDPLVEEHFDLIHVRSAVARPPGSREVLAKLSMALAPGGVIGFDRLEFSANRYLLNSPDPAARRRFERFQDALGVVLAGTGIDPHGRPTHQAMCQLGLVDVDTQVWARSWRGGEPGCLLLRTLAGELREQLAGAGMTHREIDDCRTLLLHPGLVIRGCLAVSTIGWKRPVPSVRSGRRSGRASPMLARTGRPHPSRP